MFFRVGWRSFLGGSEVFIKSRRFAPFRNRNFVLWHLALGKSSYFVSDNSTKLTANQTVSSKMSTFNYPIAKRNDFVENLHGNTVKLHELLLS